MLPTFYTSITAIGIFFGSQAISKINSMKEKTISDLQNLQVFLTPFDHEKEGGIELSIRYLQARRTASKMFNYDDTETIIGFLDNWKKMDIFRDPNYSEKKNEYHEVTIRHLIDDKLKLVETKACTRSLADLFRGYIKV